MPTLVVQKMILRLSLIAVTLWAGCRATEAPHPAVGQPVRSLSLVSVADPHRPVPEFSGRVTLLNFWATWCPPCRRELPGLARLGSRLAEDPRFQLIAVACDNDTAAPIISRFLAEQRLEVDAWIDPAGETQSRFARDYGFTSLPTTYLIGADAHVQKVWVGYREGDEADMARAVMAALRDAANRPGASPAAR